MLEWFKNYKRTTVCSKFKTTPKNVNSERILIICDQTLINSSFTKYTDQLSTAGFKTYTINIAEEAYQYADLELKPSQNTWYDLPKPEILQSISFNSYGHTLLFLNSFSPTVELLLLCNPSDLVVSTPIPQLKKHIDVAIRMESNFDTLSYIQEIQKNIDSLNP